MRKAFKDLKLGDKIKVGNVIMPIAKEPIYDAELKCGVAVMKGGHKIHGLPDQQVTLEK